MESLTELRSKINQLTSQYNQQAAEAADNKNDGKFLTLSFGHTSTCNEDPNSELLLTTYDAKGNMILYIPVVINDFATQGKPFQKKRYFRGSQVTTSDGTPVTDTHIPQIVGRTNIISSTIQFRDLTLTGFASVQIGSLTPDEIQEKMDSSSHLSLEHIRSVTGAEPGMTECKSVYLETPKLHVTDPTDDITRTHEFDPSDPR